MDKNQGYNRCDCCGAELPPSDAKTRGRPRLYCDQDCQDLALLRRKVVALQDKILAKRSSQEAPRTLHRFRTWARTVGSELVAS